MPIFPPTPRRELRLALLALLLTPLAGLSGCGKAPPSQLVEKVQVVDLLERLPQAEVKTEDIGKVMRTQISVGGESREVLFMHPPARLTYPKVRMTLESRLELSIGVNEGAWNQPGDGVQFSVYAQPSDAKEVRIFSTYLDPKHVERDRRWVDAIVTLGTYSGQDVALTLETGPGPAGNLGWDWAAWSRAALYLGPG